MKGSLTYRQEGQGEVDRLCALGYGQAPKEYVSKKADRLSQAKASLEFEEFEL